jgi:hypothetical protein
VILVLGLDSFRRDTGSLLALHFNLSTANHVFSDSVCVVHAPHSIRPHRRDVLELFALDRERQSVAIPPRGLVDDMPSCWGCSEVPVLEHVVRVGWLSRPPFNSIVVPQQATDATDSRQQ